MYRLRESCYPLYLSDSVLVIMKMLRWESRAIGGWMCTVLIESRVQNGRLVEHVIEVHQVAEIETKPVSLLRVLAWLVIGMVVLKAVGVVLGILFVLAIYGLAASVKDVGGI